MDISTLMDIYDNMVRLYELFQSYEVRRTGDLPDEITNLLEKKSIKPLVDTIPSIELSDELVQNLDNEITGSIERHNQQLARIAQQHNDMPVQIHQSTNLQNLFSDICSGILSAYLDSSDGAKIYVQMYLDPQFYFCREDTIWLDSLSTFDPLLEYLASAPLEHDLTELLEIVLSNYAMDYKKDNYYADHFSAEIAERYLDVVSLRDDNRNIILYLLCRFPQTQYLEQHYFDFPPRERLILLDLISDTEILSRISRLEMDRGISQYITSKLRKLS